MVEEAAAEPVELDIESLLSERDQFKDIALRLQADFENYRRRMSAQTNDEIDRATGRVVEHGLGRLVVGHDGPQAVLSSSTISASTISSSSTVPAPLSA